MAYLFRHRKLLPRRNVEIVEKIPSTFIQPTWECTRSLSKGLRFHWPRPVRGRAGGREYCALYQSALLTEARTSSMLCWRRPRLQNRSQHCLLRCFRCRTTGAIPRTVGKRGRIISAVMRWRWPPLLCRCIAALTCSKLWAAADDGQE